MSVPKVTIGNQISYGNKYRFTLFSNTLFQLIFYQDVKTGENYFTPENVRHNIGKYMYSLLSDLEKEEFYKINGRYEFLIHYPELPGENYNWWRQTLSPTIQTEDISKSESPDHYVLGYENVSVHYTSARWGGLCLTNNNNKSYINGAINFHQWFYAIGCYGTLEKGIPGPLLNERIYYNQVALYVKINSLDMLKCMSYRVYRCLFMNSNIFFMTILL